VRAFPPPPEYPEVQGELRGDPRGQRCFVHNVITADLTAAYADADFDGDGRPERIWQVPDCLVVIVQGAARWEIALLEGRPIPRGIDAVSLRAVSRAGGTVLRVTDTRSEPVSHEVNHWRWTGQALIPVP
jgi:hypothetical protein